MTTAHTQGPWTTQSEIVTGKKRSVYEHGETITILGCNSSYFGIAKVGGPSNFDRQTELRANAALIAAAPDLLEALENCAEQLRLFMELHDDDADTPPVYEQAIDAISKAKCY